LICGILKPTSGSVTVNGRISALLELGSGFNPEFTGRENIYFQGAIMGLSKAEMDVRIEAIIAFADIGEFIAQPVKTYSSGMFVRLAFAVAIHTEPEILIVDEALAVGDLVFQVRCFKKITEIRKRGGAILLVTHAMEQIAHFCDKAILLDKGNLIAEGGATETLNTFLRSISSTTKATELETFTKHGLEQNYFYNPEESRWGDRAAEILNCRIVQDGCEVESALVSGHFTELRLHIKFHQDVLSPIYGLTIKNYEGAILFTTNSARLANNAPSQKAGDEIFVAFNFQPFLDSGEFLISIGVAGLVGADVLPHDRRYDALRITIAAPRSSTGELVVNPAFRMVDSL